MNVRIQFYWLFFSLYTYLYFNPVWFMSLIPSYTQRLTYCEYLPSNPEGLSWIYVCLCNFGPATCHTGLSCTVLVLLSLWNRVLWFSMHKLWLMSEDIIITIRKAIVYLLVRLKWFVIAWYQTQLLPTCVSRDLLVS